MKVIGCFLRLYWFMVLAQVIWMKKSDQNNDIFNSLNKFLKMIAKKQIEALPSKFENIYNLSDEEAKST